MARKERATQGAISTGEKHAPRGQIANGHTMPPGSPASDQLPFLEMVAEFDKLEAAAKQLARSDRGRKTMQHLLDWFDDVGLGLDGENKQAVRVLLEGVWGPYCGSGRDVMRDQLEQHKQ